MFMIFVIINFYGRYGTLSNLIKDLVFNYSNIEDSYWQETITESRLKSLR